MTVRENLIAARALIDTPEKWGKGWADSGSVFDVVRAIQTATSQVGNTDKVPDALTLALPDGFDTLWIFNDVESTTHADILALFDRAIAAQSEDATNTTETALLWNVRDEQPPSNLAEFTNRLYGAALSIPAEYRDSARIDVDPYCEFGESYPQVRVTYTRPMTATELAEYAKEETEFWTEQLRNAEDRAAYCREQLGGKP